MFNNVFSFIYITHLHDAGLHADNQQRTAAPSVALYVWGLWLSMCSIRLLVQVHTCLVSPTMSKACKLCWSHCRSLLQIFLPLSGSYGNFIAAIRKFWLLFGISKFVIRRNEVNCVWVCEMCIHRYSFWFQSWKCIYLQWVEHV